MEPQHNHSGRRSKIAWIALAVGLLALGFTLGSHRSGMNAGWQGQRGQMGWQQNNQQWQQGQMPAMPMPPQAAQAPQAPQAQRGPDTFQQGPRGHMMDGHAMMMHKRGGPGGFFGVIFGLISGLFKLAFWGIALFLIVKVLQDRRNGGSGPKGNGGDQNTPRPGPEQPPYTGHTTSL